MGNRPVMLQIRLVFEGYGPEEKRIHRRLSTRPHFRKSAVDVACPSFSIVIMGVVGVQMGGR